MGADDDIDCAHAWVLEELHLSMRRGVEQAKSCSLCGAVAYVADSGRVNREPLPPPRDF